MPSSSLAAAAGSQYVLDLLARLPDPRKRRGRRHWLAGLLGVGIAAVTAGSRSFAAIGRRAADAGAGVLAGLGAVRGPVGESTFRRAFALISADVPGQVIGAWLHARAAQAGGRLVIAASALHGQSDTAQAITGRHAGYVMTVKASMPALCKLLKKLPGPRSPRPRP
jgi:DDE_Tnp_1-associated